MASRADKHLVHGLIQTWVVTAASVVTEFMPVTLTAEKTARDSTAGENCSAIAMESATAGQKFQAILLTGGMLIPVKVGTAGAAAGAYAEVGTTGLITRTLGGGTTVRYIAGKFNQAGVSGDIVGLVSGQFAGGSS
jgi:hypothetical protein